MKPAKLYDVFAENLRRLRLERGWSQDDLARELSADRDAVVHVPYISDLERGKKKPSMETLARMSEVFDVTPAELLEENLTIPA